MNAITRALKNEEEESLWDSSLLWSTVALYSFAALAFFWADFVKVITWIGA